MEDQKARPLRTRKECSLFKSFEIVGQRSMEVAFRHSAKGGLL